MSFNTTCKNITKNIKELKRIRALDHYLLISGVSSDEEVRGKDEMRKLFESEKNRIYETLFPSNEDVIRDNEEFYNWLKISGQELRREYEENEIIWPSIKQRIEAARNNYDQYLVIPPGYYSAYEHAINIKLAEIHPNGKIDTEQVKQTNCYDLLKERRFEKGYVIILPNVDCGDFRRSINESFVESWEELIQMRTNFPTSNLDGLKYLEYLFFVMYCLKNYPDKAKEICSSYLLGDAKELLTRYAIRGILTDSSVIKIGRVDRAMTETYRAVGTYYAVTPKEKK